MHIGKILQDAVDKTGISIDFLTHKAGYKRGTYYVHIKKENLSIKILKKYAEAIDHDFTGEVAGFTDFKVEEEDQIYKVEPKTLTAALKQRDAWKDKYYELMEKYQSLLEKMNKAIQ